MTKPQTTAERVKKHHDARKSRGFFLGEWLTRWRMGVEYQAYIRGVLMHITWPKPHLPPINLYNAPKAKNMKYKVGDMSNFKKKWEGEPADMAGPLKRPYGMTGAAKHNVYLDQYTWAKLRVIGKGNASEAIRKLVEQAP